MFIVYKYIDTQYTYIGIYIGIDRSTEINLSRTRSKKLAVASPKKSEEIDRKKERKAEDNGERERGGERNRKRERVAGRAERQREE